MMEQQTENPSEPSHDAAPPAVVLPGRILREERERQGLSVADVAEQTKLAPRQIEALEQDDFPRLPELTFVRGFVRSYAKILGLDAAPLLDSLPRSKEIAKAPVSAAVEVPFPTPLSRQQQNLIWLGAALLLSVLVVAVAVWNFTAPMPAADTVQPVALPPDAASAQRADREAGAVSAVADVLAAASAVSAAEPSAEAAPVQEEKEQEKEKAKRDAPKVETPPAPAATKRSSSAARGNELTLSFGEDAWAEVRDRDDNMLSSQVNPGGSELRLSGQPPLTVVIGRASTVRLYYRGKQVDLAPHTGASSDVARLTLE